jgi:hypothetical protein
VNPPRQPKTIIGWSEYVDFVDWGLGQLRAKVDTGARTSALHVEDLEVLPDGRVRFHVVRSRSDRHPRVEVIAPVVKWGRVRSSTGFFRKRCFVRTRVRIGDVEKEIEISLVSREKMIFRMLLGRKALEHDFLVDVCHKHTLPRALPRGRKAKSE